MMLNILCLLGFVYAQQEAIVAIGDSAADQAYMGTLQQQTFCSGKAMLPLGVGGSRVTQKKTIVAF